MIITLLDRAIFFVGGLRFALSIATVSSGWVSGMAMIVSRKFSLHHSMTLKFNAPSSSTILINWVSTV